MQSHERHFIQAGSYSAKPAITTQNDDVSTKERAGTETGNASHAGQTTGYTKSV